ncbi:MAG: 2,3-cyclic 3-phosphodiesterase [Acidobacteriota bacterium]|nr:2,3-cyclic 3-phosphodiesterase [Acidobacteriota bacterium]
MRRMTTDAQKHWRIFCAIELPAEVKASVAAHAARVRESFSQARASWERPEKLHLTLKFLGDVKVARVESLTLAVERATLAFAPFGLTIAESGAFPTQGLPRVLWLGVADESGELARLQNSLEDECAAEGFTREGRDFKPHLTIARLRSPGGARSLADAHRETHFEPQTFTVSELVLMRSELGPAGSRYTPLSRHALRR